jgi:hypothetical protein
MPQAKRSATRTTCTRSVGQLSGIDLSEHLAGKAAIQDAAAKLTERLLPKLVK